MKDHLPAAKREAQRGVVHTDRPDAVRVLRMVDLPRGGRMEIAISLPRVRILHGEARP